MKHLLIILTAVLSLGTQAAGQSRTDRLLGELDNEKSSYVMVASNRGDWRYGVENSMQSIVNAIEMGVDILCVDVYHSKDNVLMVHSDSTLHRTTSGKGKIKDFTLEQLRVLKLLNGLTQPTRHRMITLDELLVATRGKTLVCIGNGYFMTDEIVAAATRTGTEGQVLIKGVAGPKRLSAEYGKLVDKYRFIPVVSFKRSDAKSRLDDYLRNTKPSVTEVQFDIDTHPLLGYLPAVVKGGSRIWTPANITGYCGNRGDETAERDMENSWGWLLMHGVSVIQTDSPIELIRFLDHKGFRNIENLK